MHNGPKSVRYGERPPPPPSPNWEMHIAGRPAVLPHNYWCVCPTRGSRSATPAAAAAAATATAAVSFLFLRRSPLPPSAPSVSRCGPSRYRRLGPVVTPLSTGGPPRGPLVPPSLSQARPRVFGRADCCCLAACGYWTRRAAAPKTETRADRRYRRCRRD